MTNNSELARLSLALLLLDKLAERRPTITAETALEWLRSMTVQALTEPRCECTLEQAAAQIWADLDARDLLPPWD